MLEFRFFSFDGQNYARYLTYFATFLANIEASHPGAQKLIENGAISVARSFIPGNRCDVDKTMEETFMRHAKSRSGSGTSSTGVSGLLTNFQAYQRWVRTTHVRSLYVEATLDMAGMVDGNYGQKHRDVRPTEIRKGERLVRKTKEAISSFLNPFDVDMKDKLVILSSGCVVSDDIAADVLQAESLGQKARDDFIDLRLKTGKNFLNQ